MDEVLDRVCDILVELKYCPAEYLYLYNKVIAYPCKRGNPNKCSREEKVNCWNRYLLNGKLK